jgi:hypothetical protein
MTVRYDGGSIGGFPILSGLDRPFRTFTFFDDFVLDAESRAFVLTDLNSATATEAPNGEHGGVIVVGAGASTNHHGYQFGTDDIVDLTKGDMAFEARVRFSSDSSTDAMNTAAVGMQADADSAAAFSATSVFQSDDFIGFVTDGSGNLDFVVRKDDTATTIEDVVDVAGALGVTDFLRLGFSYVGNKVLGWVNGELIATVETNIPTDELLGVVAAGANGTAGAESKVAIDYVMVVAAR